MRLWLLVLLACVWSGQAQAYSYEDKIRVFNERTELYNHINPELSDQARAPNDGLDELREKLWRYNEVGKRGLERDEVDMRFIEQAIDWRDKRELVVLYSDNVAALVWLDLKTGKARNINTFFGRNVYRIRQIALDKGLLAEKVKANFASPGQSRSPAANNDPEGNATNFAEALMKKNRDQYAPEKKPYKPLKRKRYELIFIDRQRDLF